MEGDEMRGDNHCQTCEHWGWTNWDDLGECWHPTAPEPGMDAKPDDMCDSREDREDKSQDGSDSNPKEKP